MGAGILTVVLLLPKVVVVKQQVKIGRPGFGILGSCEHRTQKGLNGNCPNYNKRYENQQDFVSRQLLLIFPASQIFITWNNSKKY